MTASEYRAQAKERLDGHWGLAVGTTLVASLLGAFTTSPSISYNFDEDDSQFLNEYFKDSYYYDFIDQIKYTLDTHPVITAVILAVLIIISTWSIATFILGGATRAGLYRFNKKMYLGQNPEFKDLFSHYDIFGKAFATQLLIGIFTFLWSLLLVIPGIIATFAYSMTFYILEENPSMTTMDAINASKEMMKGHKWELFCLYLSFIGWYILSVLTLGIGFLFLSPYTNQAKYAFYYEISRKQVTMPIQPEVVSDGN